MSFLIADDNPHYRAALITLCQTHFSSYAPFIECTDGKSAIEQINTHKPELVFLDIRMAPMSGVQVAQALWKQEWFPLIVFFSSYKDEIYVRTISQSAPDQSDFGYILKNEHSDAELVRAIQQVLKRESGYIDEAVTPVFIRSNNPSSSLSDEELEALAYTAIGLADSAIAKKLCVTEEAIRWRLNGCFKKLGVREAAGKEVDKINLRTKAVSIAMKRGLITDAQIVEWERRYKTGLPLVER